MPFVDSVNDVFSLQKELVSLGLPHPARAMAARLTMPQRAGHRANSLMALVRAGHAADYTSAAMRVAHVVDMNTYIIDRAGRALVSRVDAKKPAEMESVVAFLFAVKAVCLGNLAWSEWTGRYSESGLPSDGRTVVHL
jgi:hypothetical protein